MTWQKPAKHARMGLRSELKSISAPLLCCWGSALVSICTVASQPDVLQARKRDRRTAFTLLIQDSCVTAHNRKMTIQISMKYITSLCKLLPSWIWKMWFYTGISELAINSSSTINEIMTKMLEIIACRYMAMHEPQDLGALPRSSVQLKASLTSWLNANKMVNAVSSPYV